MTPRKNAASRREKAIVDEVHEAIRQRFAQEWLRSNRAALAAYNSHIKKDGAFSDGLRSF